MDEADREEYIARVQSNSSTIGATIPESIAVAGDELALDDFLIETRKIDRIPPEAETKIREAKRVLRDERKSRFDHLSNASLDHETAEELVEEINGIDRALVALDNIRRPEYGEEAQNATLDDHERWLGFLDTVRR